LASTASLAKPGGAVTVTVAGFVDRVLVMHIADGTFAAVASTCTHAQCPVTFRSDLQLIECPCHGARYDLQGLVLRKPAPRALRQILATYDTASGLVLLDQLSALLPGVSDGQIALLLSQAGPASIVGGQLTYHPSDFSGPLTILQVGAGQFSAFAGSCTFGDCLLTYDAPTQHLTCPCHGCAFDLSGAVVNGPATLALAVYGTTSDAKTVTIAVG